MDKSISYLKNLIKKFNDNGDYHIGDELSWALDNLEDAEKEIKALKAMIVEARPWIIEHSIKDPLGRTVRWLTKTEGIKVDS